MRRIINPFEHLEEVQQQYNCFGCSPNNDIGLKLEFYDTGEEVVAEWEPRKLLEGYPGVLHGGIQATLMDEIGGWAVYVKCETAGVTQNLNVDYIEPVKISKGRIKLKARVEEQAKRHAVIIVDLIDGEGKVCSTGQITYFIFPQAIAIKRYNYPGLDAFYK